MPQTLSSLDYNEESHRAAAYFPPWLVEISQQDRKLQIENVSAIPNISYSYSQSLQVDTLPQNLTIEIIRTIPVSENCSK